MLILGLDPSLSCTGWGVIRSEGARITHIANGQVPTDPKASMAQRLGLLQASLAEVIAVHQPGRAAAEEIYVNKNAQTTLKLAQARGAVLATCGTAGEEGGGRHRRGGEGAGAGDGQGLVTRRKNRGSGRGRCAGGGHCGRPFDEDVMTIEFYGIPNCDTVKKARKWLDGQEIPYVFHDYKKEGADPEKLREWIGAKGVDAILNRRGTTWRKLTDAEKADVDETKAVGLLEANPSMIKRPVVEYPGGLLVGFDETEWAAALK